jgi:flagellar motor component MotA
MLAFSIVDLHVQGGIEYISPLSILFVVNLVLILYSFVRIVQGKKLAPSALEIIKQIGNLIMAFGVFGTLVGFLQMFDALEAMKETLPLNIISGGVKVALLAVIYGCILYCITLCGYIALRIKIESQTQPSTSV